MDTEYTGKKKVFMVVLISVLSCLAFALLSVTCYFLVLSIVPDNSDLLENTSTEEHYKKAGVASNGDLCAKIGKDVLEENGTAVDAAIATAICEGILCFQSMGIGGGFLMTIYDRTSKVMEVLNARETAPEATYENIFGGEASLAEKGGLAVAVPGELKGYLAAYRKYGGGVPWSRLFEPSIKICKDGFKVGRYLADHIQRYATDIFESPTLRKILLNQETGKLAVEGDVIKRPELGRFLEIIAKEGISPFYEGRIAREIVREIKAEGGVVSLSDLRNYQVQWMRPVNIRWGPYKMYTTPVPGSGELLAFMLNILRDFVPASDEKITSQRIIEAFKWGYGRRTELGDISRPGFVNNEAHIRRLMANLTSKNYALDIRKKIKDDATSQVPEFYGAKVAMPDDYGTCHISVLDANGNAVSLTSTVNLVFGAKFASRSTGILFNNEMADFSAPNIQSPFGLPPSPANFIKPGKRPLSSMCPTIFLDDNNDAVLVTGASGGTRITSTVAYVAFQTLVRKKGLKEAIDLPRIHHQLFPMEVDYETGFPMDIVKRLKRIGHVTKETAVTKTSTVTAVGKLNGDVIATYDYRRGGSVSGY